MAAGFWSEIADFAESTNIPSREFLKEATRLKETGHEHKLNDLLARFKLTACIPMTLVSLGTMSTQQHPVLRPRDFISLLDHEGKLDLLFCGHTGVDYKDFWDLWRLVEDDHPIFKVHKRNLSSCIPIWVFADEGTSQKKKALMVLQFQPILGRGSKRAEDINMSGVSVTTRFLYSVLSGKVYAGKKNQQEPLHNLVSCFAKDIGNCFHQEIPVQSASWTEKIFLICLGLKGDLAALVKLGKLQRNYMRDTMSGKGAGICHLCRGGQENFSYHETDFNIMTEMRRDVPLPWTQQPSLLNSIPHSPSRKAAFFKLDLFHILLKGVFGDIAANAIAPQKPIGSLFEIGLIVLCGLVMSSVNLCLWSTYFWAYRRYLATT